MARPMKVIQRVSTLEGPLELRQRGDDDFLITLAGRVLMNSHASRSEQALGRLACQRLERRAAPRVLVGGLGMGYSLRAALDSLPAAATVVVAELTAEIVQWCRGPLRQLTDGAVDDPRVVVELGDVAQVIQRAASGGAAARFDAVILDLYEGPHEGTQLPDHPLYGAQAIQRTRAALQPGGVLAVWGEDHDRGFADRLRAAGLEVTCQRPGRGGYRHAVYLAVAGGGSG